MNTELIFARIETLTDNPDFPALFWVSPNTIKTWRRRKNIPAQSVIDVAIGNGWSIDYLAYGYQPVIAA